MEWTLDPNDPNDATEDADGDGLSNICEYEWERLREDSLISSGIKSHGESPRYIENWTATDPNNKDSDSTLCPMDGRQDIPVIGLHQTRE